jgi:hypothetical protein
MASARCDGGDRLALTLAAKLTDEVTAQSVQLGLEYVPPLPFQAALRRQHPPPCQNGR